MKGDRYGHILYDDAAMSYTSFRVPLTFPTQAPENYRALGKCWKGHTVTALRFLREDLSKLSATIYIFFFDTYSS
jgi:hypothetical protein